MIPDKVRHTCTVHRVTDRKAKPDTGRADLNVRADDPPFAVQTTVRLVLTAAFPYDAYLPVLTFIGKRGTKTERLDHGAVFIRKSYQRRITKRNGSAHITAHIRVFKINVRFVGKHRKKPSDSNDILFTRSKIHSVYLISAVIKPAVINVTERTVRKDALRIGKASYPAPSSPRAQRSVGKGGKPVTHGKTALFGRLSYPLKAPACDVG